MNMNLIPLHNELLAGRADIKDVSDKDISALLQRFIMDSDLMVYPDFDVYVMAWDEQRRRKNQRQALAKQKAEEYFQKLKKKKKTIKKDFFI